MSNRTRDTKADCEIVSRYTDQPPSMPADLRERIEKEWGGQPVQLYALTDLDASLRFSRSWVALGPDRVAVACEGNGHPAAIRSFERSRVAAVRETPCLSCTVLLIEGDPDAPPLAVLRYTHRQRRSIENLKFILEQQIKGHKVETEDPDAVYAETVAEPVRKAQGLFGAKQTSVLWRLLAYLKPYKVRFGLGLASAVILTLVSFVPPYLTKYLIDDIIKPMQAGKLQLDKAFATAWVIVGAIAVVTFIRQFLSWVRLRTMALLGEFIARDLRRDLYAHIQKLSMSFFSSKETGSIIARITSDTDRLWEFIAFGSIEFIIAIVTLVGLGAVLLAMDWRLGLILTAPTPLLFFAIHKFGGHMHRICLRAWRKWSTVTEVLADTIPGIRVVKAFNQEKREKGRFDARNTEATRVFSEIHIAWTTFWPITWFFVQILMLLVWVFAMPRLLGAGTESSAPLTLGVFIMFLLYMGMFVQPIDIIGRMTWIMNRATSSAHRVFEVLDTRPEIISDLGATKLEPIQGSVEFDNVTFAYDGVRQIIRNMSFKVEPGEMVGLVGPSGGGKTTITNLIARFYDVGSGRILIDGVDVRDLDIGHYRRQIGMVLQDPHLFHGSILDNIRYGLPGAEIERIIEAARTANAHDFICRLPHGYDTIVGERGHTLSGGERQRVSIARAILHNPRVLILDEATSSVDTETERKIQEALDRLIAGRTVFAIAHRLSTLRRANRLFVIEDGRITESGTHSELLETDGLYAKLHKMQQELHDMFAV